MVSPVGLMRCSCCAGRLGMRRGFQRRLVIDAFGYQHSSELIKGSPVRAAFGAFAGESLPAANGDIDVERINLDREATPAGGVGGDQGRSAAEERVVDRLPNVAIVENWAPHALDRLLGPVLGFRVLAPGGDAPQR